ncbi:helix-turn-helix domain-containing protein [Acinetobacter indicus]|uniref:helix-turn-helix domain-containing protein n=1 Tax=Acinetobacter indicus TaxID=756892 RepID=UPI00209A66FF|nr:helix-turn-helix transcriptional regulator [Acinetobacter indicus]MCO8088204.1 helix-turn-helix domain-containing protein [Acinetobacter indicus]
MNTKDQKEPFFDEKRLNQVVGENCRRAREIAGLTRKEAQNRIFRYKNEDMSANRISEIETGGRKVDLKLLYRIATEYGCSVDYLLGLSNEFERNLAASYTGMVFNSIRGTALEMTERICMQMSEAIRCLPQFQGELLRCSSKNVVDIVDRLSHDLAFRGNYPELMDAVLDLRSKVQGFDQYFAKQMRIIELNMLEQLHHRDDEMASRAMADTN